MGRSTAILNKQSPDCNAVWAFSALAGVRRQLLWYLAAIILLSVPQCGQGPSTPNAGPPFSPPSPSPNAAPGQTLWSADHETGDLSQWYFPSRAPGSDSGGGKFNSGVADSEVSQEHAHSGQWSVRMQATPPPKSGTRLFRWSEPRKYEDVHYSAWFYFPQSYKADQWWNIMQWKSKRPTSNDPFLMLNVGNRGNEAMYLYLHNWQTKKSYPAESSSTVPVGRWFKVEAQYRCAADESGRARVWLDGALVFDVAGVQTRYGDGDCEWSINNYTEAASPSPIVIYMDDAAITLPRSVR
jgi:hypothetical protein